VKDEPELLRFCFFFLLLPPSAVSPYFGHPTVWHTLPKEASGGRWNLLPPFKIFAGKNYVRRRCGAES